MSGILGGLVRGDASFWRLSWLGGLAAGAAASSALCPEAFFTFPETYSLARAVSGGEHAAGPPCALLLASAPHAMSAAASRQPALESAERC